MATSHQASTTGHFSDRLHRRPSPSGEMAVKITLHEPNRWHRQCRLVLPFDGCLPLGPVLGTPDSAGLGPSSSHRWEEARGYGLRSEREPAAVDKTRRLGRLPGRDDELGCWQCFHSDSSGQGRKQWHQMPCWFPSRNVYLLRLILRA